METSSMRQVSVVESTASLQPLLETQLMIVNVLKAANDAMPGGGNHRAGVQDPTPQLARLCHLGLLMTLSGRQDASATVSIVKKKKKTKKM